MSSADIDLAVNILGVIGFVAEILEDVILLLLSFFINANVFAIALE